MEQYYVRTWLHVGLLANVSCDIREEGTHVSPIDFMSNVSLSTSTNQYCNTAITLHLCDTYEVL